MFSCWNFSKVEPTTAENLEGGQCAFRVCNCRLRIQSGIFSRCPLLYRLDARNIVFGSVSYQKWNERKTWISPTQSSWSRLKRTCTSQKGTNTLSHSKEREETHSDVAESVNDLQHTARDIFNLHRYRSFNESVLVYTASVRSSQLHQVP